MIRPGVDNLRILVACEFSGRVRDSFSRMGHYALSCDLKPSLTPGNHYQGSVFDVLHDGWDILIAHPPCTFLSRSGARWRSSRMPQFYDALIFFGLLLESDIPRKCLENPIGAASTWFGSPDQVIQPSMFGHPYKKTTCLWLRGLPPLVPTCVVPGVYNFVDTCQNVKTRSSDRSVTFQGIASAMASQWAGPGVHNFVFSGGVR